MEDSGERLILGRESIVREVALGIIRSGRDGSHPLRGDFLPLAKSGRRDALHRLDGKCHDADFNRTGPRRDHPIKRLVQNLIGLPIEHSGETLADGAQPRFLDRIESMKPSHDLVGRVVSTSGSLVRLLIFFVCNHPDLHVPTMVSAHQFRDSDVKIFFVRRPPSAAHIKMMAATPATANRSRPGRRWSFNMTDMARSHDKFQFTVDGASHGTNDKTMDGSQIREEAGLTPASDFVLVQIVNGIARSISIEEDVTFERGKIATFLSFRSDRTYSFTVNERGWEWGEATILAADIFRYAGIDEDHELILDSAGDAPIPDDGEVRLDGAGVERVRSREPKTVNIKVNGRTRTVEKRRHSYREIAKIAYPDADFDNFNYTITYLHGVGGAEGDLVEGETVQVKKGMVFNVRRSDKS